MTLPDPSIKSLQSCQRNWDALSKLIYTGKGSPENIVPASIGAIYLREDGGASTTIYIKESGAGTNAGWIAK